jgi:hypothetical protein
MNGNPKSKSQIKQYLPAVPSVNHREQLPARAPPKQHRFPNGVLAELMGPRERHAGGMLDASEHFRPRFGSIHVVV